MYDEGLSKLHLIAKNYVASLGKGDFDNIPYHDQVILRAPINPGGSEVPIHGKETLRTSWWAPLPSLVAGTEFISSYTSEDNTGVAVEFHCHIKSPQCTLRIVDRFQIDDEGLITEQENFFDPSALANPS